MRLSILSVLFWSLSFLTPELRAQGTAFTYQGLLNDGAAPANGSYDLTFSLFTDAAGPDQVGDTQTNFAVAVANGLFTVTVDFGANFPSDDRWMEISACTNGGSAFTVLSPRQQITAVPYAMMATSGSSRPEKPDTEVDLTGTNTFFDTVTIWATNPAASLQLLGDYRNGVDGERYSTVFNGFGNPGLVLNGYIVQNGNTRLPGIISDKPHMYSFGMDVPYGIIGYGAGDFLSFYEQLPDGYPTNALWPGGARVFDVNDRGTMSIVNVDGAGYPFPQIRLKSIRGSTNTVQDDYGFFAYSDRLQNGPMDAATNNIPSLMIFTNGAVSIGVTNPLSAFPPPGAFYVSGRADAIQLDASILSAGGVGINSTPDHQKFWLSGTEIGASPLMRGRLGIGISDNQEYSAYVGSGNYNNDTQQFLELGTRVGGTDTTGLRIVNGQTIFGGGTSAPTATIEVVGGGKFSGGLSVTGTITNNTLAKKSIIGTSADGNDLKAVALSGLTYDGTTLAVTASNPFAPSDLPANSILITAPSGTGLASLVIGNGLTLADGTLSATAAARATEAVTGILTNGVAVGAAGVAQLNLIAGDNMTLSATQNAGRVDVTLAAVASRGVVLHEEFMGARFSAVFSMSPLGLMKSASGPGANIGVASTSTNLGIVELKTGTGSTGFAMLASDLGNIILGGRALTNRFSFRIPSLPDETDPAVYIIGFGDSGAGSTPNDGVYVKFSTDDARMVFACRANSVETSLATSTVLSANQWYTGEIMVNADATVATFSVDGGEPVTITNNIPSGDSQALGLQASVIKEGTGTLSKTMQLDWWSLGFAR